MDTNIQRRVICDFWDERSAIRNRSRRVLKHHQDLVYFPMHEQPLCFHPIVQSLGPSAAEYILVQSSFRFMASVFEHETKIVTDVVQKLAYGLLPIPESMKQELLSVVIDELYHGYVARDFIDQVATATGVKPLLFSKDSKIGCALDKAKAKVPAPLKDHMSAVAVCIIENVITHEIIGIDNCPGVNPFFYAVNRDHLADEGRHAGIFTGLIPQIWSGLARAEKAQIQNAIPIFVEEWLSHNLAMADDVLILRSLRLSEPDIAQVIYDTHPKLDFAELSEVNPTVRHIEQWLRKVNVWDRYETLLEAGESGSDPLHYDRIEPVKFLAFSIPDEFGGAFESQRKHLSYLFKDVTIAGIFLTYLSEVLQKPSLGFVVVEEMADVRHRTQRLFRVAGPDTLVRDLVNHCDDSLWLSKPQRHRSPEDFPIPLDICFVDDKNPLINSATLRIFFDSKGESIEVTYHAGVYDSQRIAELLRDFSNYLKAISASPVAEISSLPLVSPDFVFNGSINAETHGAETTILNVLMQRAVEHPDKHAIRSQDLCLTYQQLNLRISSLSRILVDSKLCGGSCVGIIVTKRIDFVCLLLGVMKAGFIAVPLPVDCSTGHLENLIDQSKLKLILCDPDRKDSLDADIGQRMGVDVWPCHESLFLGPVLRQSHAKSDSPACVLFTSGTSGLPKGVVLFHGDLAWFAAGATDAFALLPTDVIMLFSNLCFDASLAEIVNSISAGAALAIPTSGLMDSQAQFFEECQSLGVTVLNLPAAFWGQLAARASDFPEMVRTILVYGEALSQNSLTEWYRISPKMSLINTYGPTEATIGASYCHLDQFKHLRHHQQLIGRPFLGRFIYVLDPFQRPLPFGATGQIYVGGSGTGSHYLMDPQFVPVTGDHDLLGPLYATHDIGQWLHCRDSGENILAFHGRNDHQVKICGLRIELSAVVKIISTHPAVSDAIAIVRNQDNANSIDAFVLQRSGISVSEREIRDFLREKLPSYSCPSRVSILQEWPLTQRGKVDRAQLQESLIETLSPDFAECAVINELSNVWRKLLGVAVITPESHFFELGGHSLLAMTLVGRVNERWKASLTLRCVIENPRFDSMKHRLLIAVKQKATFEALPSGRTLSTVGPASFGQQALLVADRLSVEGTPQYNVAFGLHFHVTINEQALKSAVAFVVDRQAALRCVFVWDSGRTKQNISDLSVVLTKELVGYDEYLALTHQDARIAHSLFEKPPLRVRLFQITDRPQATILYFNLHHVIHDGLSIGILMRELMVSYESFSCGQEPPMPILKESYLDFSSSMRCRIDSNRGEGIEFWRQYLKGSTPLVLKGRNDQICDILKGATHKVTIDAGDLARLRQRCQSQNINLSAAMFTATFYALRQRTLQEDYTVGSVVSLREELAHEHLVGMFVQMVLLRSNLDFDASIEVNMASVKQAIQRMLPQRHIPLSVLIEELNLPRDPHEQKVFDVMVNYHAFGGVFSSSSVGPLHPDLQFLDNNTVNVGLGIDFYDWGDQRLEIRLGYGQNIYDAGEIEDLANDLQKWIGIFANGDWRSTHTDLDLFARAWCTNDFCNKEYLC